MKKLTTQVYTDRCKKVHNNFYSYEETLYTKDKGKVTITCPVHGKFLQRCDHHMRGSGCKDCIKDKMKIIMLKDIFHFIKKANKIHNNYYDYSNSIYVNARSKIEIKCPIHGLFSVLADNHLAGHGCYH
jgi:hypothetical protein